MIVTNAEAKSYLRIDDDADDTMITLLIGAAEAYIENVTGNKFKSDNALAKLLTLILVTHWHVNRSAVVVGVVSKELEFTITPILTQLKYCYVPSESGDTT